MLRTGLRGIPRPVDDRQCAWGRREFAASARTARAGPHPECHSTVALQRLRRLSVGSRRDGSGSSRLDVSAELHAAARHSTPPRQAVRVAWPPSCVTPSG
jgi:hypothetical protein